MNGSPQSDSDHFSKSEQCSTPFGINEWITIRLQLKDYGDLVCSTPFGINEWITYRPDAGLDQLPGAQRLSASMNGSPVRSDDQVVAGQLCSTPFGINEWITDMFDEIGKALNGAQRLSASMNGSHLVQTHPITVHCCAQRLSASMNGSLQYAGKGGDGK